MGVVVEVFVVNIGGSGDGGCCDGVVEVADGGVGCDCTGCGSNCVGGSNGGRW